ncbi:MAG: redoxin domain-containing protein [Flavobacteriales bacterium]|nr:redoxin domain-containing protein [Flavobacteriales bacterium]
MKSIRSNILLLLLSIGSIAQTAPDFTINDIDGNSRHLYDELDAGNIVVLKFFTNWCSVCNNTADEVVAIYNEYQTNGDAVTFWALDRDQNETNADATTYRNNHSIPFPVIGEAYSVAQQYGVVYQPEYYIISPDRTFVQQIGYSSMQTEVDAALESVAASVQEDEVKLAALQVTTNGLSWQAPSNSRAVLTISDLSGRIIVSRLVQGQEQIDVTHLQGIYVYQMQDEQGHRFSGKVVLN